MGMPVDTVHVAIREGKFRFVDEFGKERIETNVFEFENNQPALLYFVPYHDGGKVEWQNIKIEKCACKAVPFDQPILHVPSNRWFARYHGHPPGCRWKVVFLKKDLGAVSKLIKYVCILLNINSENSDHPVLRNPSG